MLKIPSASLAEAHCSAGRQSKPQRQACPAATILRGPEVPPQECICVAQTDSHPKRAPDKNGPSLRSDCLPSKDFRNLWCREGGSNPHDRKGRRILSPLRLPVPPSRPGWGMPSKYRTGRRLPPIPWPPAGQIFLQLPGPVPVAGAFGRNLSTFALFS